MDGRLFRNNDNSVGYTLFILQGRGKNTNEKLSGLARNIKETRIEL